MRFTAVGKNHTVIVQEVDGRSGLCVPMLWLSDGESIAPSSHLLAFLVAHPFRSLTWMKTHARALGLFWDFALASGVQLDANRASTGLRSLFRKFGLALVQGTIDLRSMEDPLGLFWPSMGANRAKLLCTAIQSFSTWVADEQSLDEPRPSASQILSSRPKARQSIPEATVGLRFLILAERIRRKSFLHHTQSAIQSAKRLADKRSSAILDFGVPSRSFDDEPAVHMDPVVCAAILDHGFTKVRPGDTMPIDITSKMIFLLLAFGGLRSSEPFHLWFNDVTIDDSGRCRVLLRHPEESPTYLDNDGLTRRQYLAARGILPRNTDNSSRAHHSGWKNLPLDKSMAVPVFWLHRAAEAEFAQLYLEYLNFRRGLIRERVARGLPDHPFLFVSAGHDKSRSESHTGDPYSIGAFSRAWDRILSRTQSATGQTLLRRKQSGTTPHAPRHMYGQILVKAGVAPRVIQKAMHHRSILSQAPYTAANRKQVDQELSLARDRIEAGNVNFDGLSTLVGALGGQSLLGSMS